MSLADYVPPEFIQLFSNKNFSKALDGYFTYKVKEDEEFRSEIKDIVLESYSTQEFKASVETVLVTSDLHPIQRVAELEKVTGLETYFDDEEHELTLSEKIENLETKIESYEFRPTQSPAIERLNNAPSTKTGERAKLLVESLGQSDKDYYSARDVVTFLMTKLPDSCKVKEGIKNIRKVKQDVVQMAVEMFPTNVFTDQKKNGHKDIRLVLRNSNLM